MHDTVPVVLVFTELQTAYHHVSYDMATQLNPFATLDNGGVKASF